MKCNHPQPLGEIIAYNNETTGNVLHQVGKLLIFCNLIFLVFFINTDIFLTQWIFVGIIFVSILTCTQVSCMHTHLHGVSAE